MGRTGQYLLAGMFAVLCVMFIVSGLEFVIAGNSYRALLNLLVAGVSGLSAYNSVRRARKRGAS
jgi:hypothetical protein